MWWLIGGGLIFGAIIGYVWMADAGQGHANGL